MYIYIYIIYIYICIYVYYIYIYVYIYIHTQTHIYIYRQIYIYIYIERERERYIHTTIYIYLLYIYLYIYYNIIIHLYIHLYLLYTYIIIYIMLYLYLYLRIMGWTNTTLVWLSEFHAGGYIFSIWVFFHEHLPITALHGKREDISLTLLYYFHPLALDTGIMLDIAVGSSPLHITSIWIRNREALDSQHKLLTTKLPTLTFFMTCIKAA